MSGQSFAPIPRGIEVLVKKAAVDPEFRAVLLEHRAAAAQQIDLELEPSEAMMLRAVTDGQLEAIIARTTVPQQHRRAFLGKAAAAMLAAVGVMGPGAAEGFAVGKTGGGGAMADRPQRNRGPVQEPPAPTVKRRVNAVIARQLGVSTDSVSPDTRFGNDILADVDRHEEIRKALGKEFQITIPARAFERVQTAGPAADYVIGAIVEPRVVDAVAERANVGKDKVTRRTSLVGDLRIGRLDNVRLRTKLATEFHIHIPFDTFKSLATVGDVVEHIENALRSGKDVAGHKHRPVSPPAPEPAGIRPEPVPPRPDPGPVSRGMRPDRIPIGGIRPGSGGPRQ